MCQLPVYQVQIKQSNTTALQLLKGYNLQTIREELIQLYDHFGQDRLNNNKNKPLCIMQNGSKHQIRTARVTAELTAFVLGVPNKVVKVKTECTESSNYSMSQLYS